MMEATDFLQRRGKGKPAHRRFTSQPIASDLGGPNQHSGKENVGHGWQVLYTGVARPQFAGRACHDRTLLLRSRPGLPPTAFSAR